MITQKRLKQLYSLDFERGVLVHKIARVGVLCGSDAGTTTKYGYTAISIEGKKYLAHRLIWLYVTGDWPSEQIDHINHARRDNRFLNLREVTDQENKKNLQKCRLNTSGTTGVYFDKQTGKWRAKIKVSGKTISIGRYKNKDEAVIARKSAENKYGFHKNHGAAN